MLVIVETHPIQYHAPVYRAVQQQFGVPVHVVYGSDFSVAGYRDDEFGASLSWDTDLLSGYSPHFLDRVEMGGAESMEAVSTKGLRRLLISLAPKAVMLVGYSPAFHQKAFLQARRLGKPLLFRGETTSHARNRSFVKQLLWSKGLRSFYNQFSALLYIGSQSLAHYKEIGCDDDKLVFSPYCVDVTPFACSEDGRSNLRASTRRELEIPDTSKVLLFSGKLSARKGPDVLVRAAQSISSKSNQHMTLVFLGSGAMQSELESLLEDASERMPNLAWRFLGFRNQTEISRFYHASDLLVLPSRSLETWGLVVNEALHHGLPCLVSTAVGSGPDLVGVGDTGRIFESDSVESLCDALEWALRFESSPEFRQRCRDRVSRFSVENAADGIARAYYRALG